MAIEDDLFIEFLGDGMQHILDKKNFFDKKHK